MAQVPNRYFNSPWIADAARNLSLAIAGDPDREAQRLQAKQIEAQMKQQEQVQDIAVRKDFEQQLGNDALSRFSALPNTDEVGKRRELADVFRYLGATPATLQAGGIFSPGYDAKEALQRQKDSANLERIAAGSESRERIAAGRNDTQLTLGDMRFLSDVLGINTRAETADEDRAGRKDIADNRPGKLPDVSPADRKNMMLDVTELADQDGIMLSPQASQRVIELTAKNYQDTNDYPNSLSRAYQKVKEEAHVERGEKGFWPWSDDEPDQLVLQAQAALSDAVTGGGGGAPGVTAAPGVAAPAAAPPGAAPMRTDGRRSGPVRGPDGRMGIGAQSKPSSKTSPTLRTPVGVPMRGAPPKQKGPAARALPVAQANPDTPPPRNTLRQFTTVAEMKANVGIGEWFIDPNGDERRRVK